MPDKRYALTPVFERVVVRAMITDTKFVARIGSVLEAECMPTEEARLIVSCALVYLKETGKPLSSAAALCQRLRVLTDKGTLLKEDALNAGDYLDSCLAESMPDRDELIHELAVVVKRHREGVILEDADKLYSKNKSITGIKDQLAALENLGKTVENPTVLPSSAFNLIRETRKVNRLTTGCQELDDLLGGGMARGELGFGLGNLGSGKSQFLSQLAQAGLSNGVHVLVATLEVATGDWYARVFAGLTEVPQTAISNGEMTSIAEERWNHLVDSGRVGSLRIRDFPTKVTQIEDIFEWVDAQSAELARELGPEHRFELLILDYADKLGFPSTSASGYEGYGYVYEMLRLGIKERAMWGWTVSQSKGSGKKSGKLLDAEDSADSLGKGRATDVCVTLNLNDDHSCVNLFLSKNRTGKGRKATGDIPTDFAMGRLTRPSTPSLFAPPRAPTRPPIGEQGSFGL